MDKTTFDKSLKGPRFRNKSKFILNKELFNKFLKKYPEYKNLNYETFKEVIKSFNNKLVDKVIEERNGVALPENLGVIVICSFKPKNNSSNFNFKLSNEHGKNVKNRNLNTEDLLCKIFYTNYNYRMRLANRAFWKFTPHRSFKRKVSKEFIDNYNKYILINSDTKVSSLYDKK
jgi:hypothetical protein